MCFLSSSEGSKLTRTFWVSLTIGGEAAEEKGLFLVRDGDLLGQILHCVL